MSFNMFKQKWDYDFKPISPVDFECTFSCRAANKLFKKLFDQSRAKLAHKGVNVMGSSGDSIDLLDSFPVDKSYYNLLYTAVRKPLDEVITSVGRDSILVNSSRVVNAFFVKKDDFWIVNIVVGGTYDDRR